MEVYVNLMIKYVLRSSLKHYLYKILKAVHLKINIKKTKNDQMVLKRLKIRISIEKKTHIFTLN